MWELTNGVNFCGVNRKILRKSSNLEIMFYGFPKEEKHIWANSKIDGLVHLGVQYCLLNIIVIIFSTNNFEQNPILVNVNKLKPYTLWIMGR
jgi:hypothetical protein